MSDDHAPLGLLVAALAGVTLALSVFTPWYRVNITASGAAAARQELAAIAKQYGNSTFQMDASGLGAQFKALSGRQLATVSAHQALSHESLILLVLGGIALLASLLRLADLRGLLFATGSQIALVGGLAFAVVFFRVLVHPGAGGGPVAFSPSWGIWLSLLSGAAIAAGGLLAGSDRSSTRVSAKHGPGPPRLGAPPSIQDLAHGAPLNPPSRRR